MRTFIAIIHQQPRQIFSRIVKHFYKPSFAQKRPAKSCEFMTHGQYSVRFLRQSHIRQNGDNLLIANHDISLHELIEGKWEMAKLPAFVQYNILYFDFLGLKGIPNADKIRIIRNFIELEEAKYFNDPFVISIRNINLVKFLLLANHRDTEIYGYVQLQYKFLRKNIEYHLGGNHLLINFLSLLLTECLPINNHYSKLVDRQFTRLLRAQFRGDGSHIENSSMYNRLILQTILDVIALLPPNHRYRQQLLDKAGCLLNWLQYMSTGRGEQPEFGDASNGYGPQLADLLAYATSLGLQGQQLQIKLEAYKKIMLNEYTLWIKTDAPSPAYNPGHSHDDFGSFVLVHKNRFLIVDTGVSQYQAGSIRASERSVHAHNVAIFQNHEQNQKWDAFRMGRRIRNIAIHETKDSLELTYRSFSRRAPLQKRTFYWDDRSIRICDEVLNKNGISGQTVLHFAPEQTPRKTGDREISLESCRISYSGGESTLQPYKKAVTFYQRKTAQKLLINFVDIHELVIHVA
jgi:hypothetical protein